MPYDDLLPLHAPIRRPLLHPFRCHAARRSVRYICEWMGIESPREVIEGDRLLERPEWTLAGMWGESDSWINWHRRRAGIELVAWHWATQVDDWRDGRYDQALRDVSFGGRGRYHREVGPALIGRTRLEWYRDNRPHRADGPARIDASAGIAWMIEGVPHREAGPAVIDGKRGVMYYREGRLHRVGGPAWSGGEAHGRQWWVDGQLHRIDGPAVLTHACEVCAPAGVCRQWYVSGQRHREDGPAIIHADGVMEWHRHGVLHRDDGPAIDRPMGMSEWYRGGTPVNILDEAAAAHGATSFAEEFFF